MKVLYLLDELNRGGAETLTLDICNNAKKYGLDLLCVSMRGGDLENEFRNSGVPFIKLERRSASDIRVIKQIRHVIEEYEIKIVHSHIIVAAVYAYCATFGLNVKNVFTHHGFSIPEKVRDELLKKFLVPHMDMNIAVSKSFLNKLALLKAYNIEKNFSVVYNGIDTKKFIVKDRDRKSGKDLVFGMVGNFINEKDQITICRALKVVLQKHSNIEFLFVGKKSERSPEEYERCYNFCQENGILGNVKFLGARSDVPDILNTLDVFVFSSLNESFGIAPIEAMLCEVPAILSDIDAMKEISNNGKYSLLYKAGDSNDLALKINTLLEDETLRLKLGVFGKNYACANFTIEKHLENLLRIYRKIL